jgi:hypothetical protein
MALDLYPGAAASVPTRGDDQARARVQAARYVSHELQFSKQDTSRRRCCAEPARPRAGAQDGEFVCSSRWPVSMYLDRKYIRTCDLRADAESRHVMRVICEYQAYVEQPSEPDRHAVSSANLDEHSRAGHSAAIHRRRRRSTHDRGPLSKSDWLSVSSPVGCRLRGCSRESCCCCARWRSVRR